MEKSEDYIKNPRHQSETYRNACWFLLLILTSFPKHALLRHFFGTTEQVKICRTRVGQRSNCRWCAVADWSTVLTCIWCKASVEKTFLGIYIMLPHWSLYNLQIANVICWLQKRRIPFWSSRSCQSCELMMDLGTSFLIAQATFRMSLRHVFLQKEGCTIYFHYGVLLRWHAMGCFATAHWILKTH